MKAPDYEYFNCILKAVKENGFDKFHATWKRNLKIHYESLKYNLSYKCLTAADNAICFNINHHTTN